MLLIKQKQLDTLGENSKSSFHKRLAIYIKQYYPGLSEKLTELELEFKGFPKFLEYCSYKGISSEAAIVHYVIAYMLLNGPPEENQEYAFRNILANSSISQVILSARLAKELELVKANLE